MSLDNIILQLGVMANVPENGRLRRDNSGKISIEEASSFQPVLRTYNRDSRRRTIGDIGDILGAAFEKSDDLMNSVYVSFEYELKPNEEKERQKVLDNLSRLEKSLKESVNGIDNLKTTYASDKTTIIQLALFNDKIEKKVSEICAFIAQRTK